MVIRKRRDSVYSNTRWLFIDKPRLCFAIDQILPFPIYHENFRTYFARNSILQEALFYRLHFTVFSLLYDLFLERKNVSLPYDLSLQRNTAVVLKLCVATPRCVVSIFQGRRGIIWFCVIKSRSYCVKRTLIVDSIFTFF